MILKHIRMKYILSFLLLINICFAQSTITTTSVSGGSDGDNCVVSDTRINLINLRNAGGLVVGCHYIVTDHVQTRLVAGTTITLHADSPTEFSENATVNTTYDNEGWRGIYDIDRGIVLELQDNRNNVARGFNGFEVSNFDWGNNFITNVLVDNSTWTTTYGQTRSITNVEIKGGSLLNTTTWVGGSINRLFVSGGSVVTLTSANVSLLNFNCYNGSNVNLTAYTGATTLQTYNLSTGIINLSNSTSQVTINNVTIENSTLQHTSVTTGTITGTGLYMYNSSLINHSNGALNLSLNRVTLDEASSITHSSKTISLSSYKILEGSSINSSTSVGTGGVTLNNGEIKSQSTINNLADYSIKGTRFIMDRASNISTANGAIGTLTLTNSKLDNQGQITIGATSTSGNITFTNGLIEGSAFIQKNGTGAITCSYTYLIDQSRIVLTGANSINTTRSTFNGLTQINCNSASAITSGIIDCNFAVRSNINFTSTGATGNNLFYVDGSGISTNISFSGTSASQTLQQSNIDNSTFSCANNTVANSYTFCHIKGSTLSVTGLTVNKNPTQIYLDANSTLTINAPTGAGGISLITCIGNSNITITGTAGTSSRLTAINQAGIIHNGGRSTNIIKQMANTLTTGNFNHSNLIMISPTTRTLTGNNTNRSEYLGIVSTAPLF